MNNNESPITAPTEPEVVGLRDLDANHTYVAPARRTVPADQLGAGQPLTGAAMSFRQYIDACLDVPGFQTIARALPNSNNRTGKGRRSKYPVELFLLQEMLSAASAGGQTAMLAELREPAHWARVQEQFKIRFDCELPDEPPTRRVIQTWHAQHLQGSNDPNHDITALTDAVRPAFRQSAIDLARKINLLRVPAEPDFDNIGLRNTIAGDGTWLRPWSKAEIRQHEANLETGEGPWIEAVNSTAKTLRGVRVANNAQYVKKPGTDGLRRGYVGFTARDDISGRRVVLDLAPMPSHTGEITTARKVIEDIIADAEGGVLAFAYDMAFVGQDLTAVMRRGVLPVVKMRRQAATTCTIRVPAELERHLPVKREKGQRHAGPEVKNCIAHRLRVVEHTDENGQRCEHVLYSYDGSVVDAVEGSGTNEIPRARWACKHISRRRTGGPGNYWFHLDLEVPCPQGTFTTTVEPQARYTSPTGVGTSLAAIAYDHDDFDRLSGRRNDIESTWSWMKSTLQNRRSPRLYHGPEYIHLIAVAALNNARTNFWFEQARQAPDLNV